MCRDNQRAELQQVAAMIWTEVFWQVKFVVTEGQLDGGGKIGKRLYKAAGID
jgi:hypothetical protein